MTCMHHDSPKKIFLRKMDLLGYLAAWLKEHAGGLLFVAVASSSLFLDQQATLDVSYLEHLKRCL